MEAVLKIDKTLGMKTDKKTVAVSGDVVTVYNTSHDPVFLCITKRGFTFPIHSDNLIIKTDDKARA